MGEGERLKFVGGSPGGMAWVRFYWVCRWSTDKQEYKDHLKGSSEMINNFKVE